MTHPDAARCLVCNEVIDYWVIAESMVLGFAVEVCSASCSVELSQRRLAKAKR